MSPSRELELGGLVARELREHGLTVPELQVHADLEPEVAHARHLRLARLVVGLRAQRDVVRAHEQVVDLRDRAEEAHDERVRGPVVELARVADLLDVGVVHDRDVVGDGERLLLVVGDQQGRHVDLLVQAAQPLAQLGADLGVQRAERLVEQQHLRLDRQRSGERHALALSAAELGRVALGEAAEADDLEQLVDALVGLLLGRLADLQPEADVVVHGHVLERRVVLEDEPDPALLRRDVRDVLAEDRDGPGIGVLEPADDPQQRRLAGATTARAARSATRRGPRSRRRRGR